MRVHGFGSGPPQVMLLHGFTQQGMHMREAARLIGHSCIAPDLPGHGPEPHLPATMDEAVDQVVALAGGVKVLVGYSMGGRVALRAALQLPDLELLVLVSATAGLADEERGPRRESDEVLARRFESEPLDEMIDGWRALPLFVGMSRRPELWNAQDREWRLEAEGSGLAASLRGMGQGSVARITDEDLASLSMDVECVAGAADEKYAIEAERMASLIPNGLARIHPTAGHAVMGEDPGFAVRGVRIRLL